MVRNAGEAEWNLPRTEGSVTKETAKKMQRNVPEGIPPNVKTSKQCKSCSGVLCSLKLKEYECPDSASNRTFTLVKLLLQDGVLAGAG